MTGRILVAAVLFGAPPAFGLLLARLRPRESGIALSRLDLLIPVGLALQLVPFVPRSTALAGGYAVLLVWGVVRVTTSRGLGRMAFGTLVVGGALNALPILLNGAMPYRASARCAGRRPEGHADRRRHDAADARRRDPVAGRQAGQRRRSGPGRRRDARRVPGDARLGAAGESGGRLDPFRNTKSRLWSRRAIHCPALPYQGRPLGPLSREGTGATGLPGERPVPWAIEYIGEEAGFGGREERVFCWRFSHGGIRSIDVRFVVDAAADGREAVDAPVGGSRAGGGRAAGPRVDPEPVPVVGVGRRDHERRRRARRAPAPADGPTTTSESAERL